MYASLWRVLPGPWFVKLFFFLLLIAAVVFVLFTWVFPWIDLMLNPQEVTVE